MNRNARRNAVILLLVALGAAVVLASSLADLRLGPGTPFPGASGKAVETEAPTISRALPPEQSLPLLRGILATILLALLLFLLLRIVTSANLRSILGVVLALAAIAVLLAILPPIPPSQAVSLPVDAASADPSSFEYPTAPLGKPPVALTWIAVISGIAGVAIVIAIAVRHRTPPRSVAEQLREEAEKAVAALGDAADSTNVVIRCYLQMTRLIQDERGLARDRHMTVREFELALESMALPSTPLRQLRALFEAVRYGNRKFSAQEDQLALRSLQEIAASVRGDA
jgi:Domain of unknown function (DUF4129)